ncbi:MAG TPA: 5'/3'-nucleotidase SurE, partial [Myxococcaceae bacterium]|nr:5'/3'-nucleotidase SurE [Myxococcaceae bacterium]
MRILVSNDDGVGSAGLAALVEAVEPLGEVWVVAPEHEQSAASHAITLARPLRIRRVRERWFSVDGTPTDCAYLAIHHLMKDAPPALAVSGINHGPNMADDVVYSGTVAAAMEATLLGVPAIAFSLVARGRGPDFTHAAAFARSLTRAALSQTLPPRLLLNVNVPSTEPRGWAVTRLGRH